MGSYKVISGQNLYDVALHIYGSMEGITDLLINNPSLSMASTLTTGQELIYSDGYVIDAETVAYLRNNNIVPSNGERGVYFKESQYPRIAEFRTSQRATSAEISFSGSGVMEIDWGDNSPLQNIILGNELTRFTHTFDNTISGLRKIRIYGDFRIRQADLTALNPSAVFILSPVYLEELTFRDCRAPLAFLSMLQGIYSLDLSGIKTNNLLPIAECRQLMSLDLSDMDVLQENIDGLLIAFVREHYGRRNCTVTLTEMPSGEYREPDRDDDLNYILSSGMEAVWQLTNEPAWNEGGPWEFVIEGNFYKYDEWGIVQPEPDPEPEPEPEPEPDDGLLPDPDDEIPPGILEPTPEPDDEIPPGIVAPDTGDDIPPGIIDDGDIPARPL